VDPKEIKQRNLSSHKIGFGYFKERDYNIFYGNESNCQIIKPVSSPLIEPPVICNAQIEDLKKTAEFPNITSPENQFQSPLKLKL
jgi:hypothetical protein